MGRVRYLPAMSKKANRLAQEASPYLLQHAHDQVDWFPWGKEAFDKAKAENKPILLSIGYSACHYCHLMARESFQHEAIGSAINRSFVAIKVDREERPDLDALYMAATVALTGQGGWPMTVFLTPDAEPFFAGTYFPREDQNGRPGLSSLLERIEKLWKSDQKSLLSQAESLTAHVKQANLPDAPGSVSEDLIKSACRALKSSFDPAFGGFSQGPKFPSPSSLALLLLAHRRLGDPELLQMATRTLDSMLSGGLFDQIGGGFHRYCVDRAWLVPHFEKMLHDSAQLADIYIEAFQVTGATSYRRAARQTLDFVLREMQAPGGGFFSSMAAETDGEEGKYYVYSRAEVAKALGEPTATHFCAFYGITDEGSFRGKSVLSARRTLTEVAKEYGIDPGRLVESVEVGREKLLAHRQTRSAPAIDDKIIVSHNSLMIRALAHGARAFGEERYLEGARRAADLLLAPAEDGGLRKADGGLYRMSRGGKVQQDAFLEDYTFLIDGLLALIEVDGSDRYLAPATSLMDYVIEHFSAENGSFYSTPQAQEPTLSRPHSGADTALPSENAIACKVLRTLAILTDRPEWQERAAQLVGVFSASMKRTPRAFSSLLCAVDGLLEPPLEIVLAGDPEDDGFAEMGRCLGSRYLPHRAEVRLVEEPKNPAALLRNRFSNSAPARTYLCRDFACETPIESAQELTAELDRFEKELLASRRKELLSRRISGRATHEGTKKRRALEAPETSTEIDGLWVSRLGLGTHRIGLDHPNHRAAVRRALTSGTNFIDTSPSFAMGDSERLIGQVLGELSDEGVLTRDQIVLVSKVGVFVGSAAEDLARRYRETSPRFACPLNPKAEDTSDLAKGAFCLDDDALEEQISTSLERLGVDHLDICLIQSPEHFLAAGRSQDELEEALLSAFNYLEKEVSSGRIGRYGVLCNTAARPSSDPLFIDASFLVHLAERVGGKDHHFRVIELPLSVADSAALSTDSGQPHLIEKVRSLGLFPIACRALSPIVGGALLRLVDPVEETAPDSAEQLRRARYMVASLEAEFETTFAAQLRLAKKAPEGRILPLSGPLGQALEQTATRQQFDLAETTMVTPRLRQLLTGLDQAFAGDQKWTRFREKYVRAVGTWLAAVRGQATKNNGVLLDDLKQQIETTEPWSAAAATFKESKWQARALGLLLGVEPLAAIFVGMRSPDQVDEILSIQAKK